MPRPPWRPTTAEEKAALAAIRRAAHAADAAEDVLWEAVKAARALNIPAELAAREAGRSKATLYRRLGTDDASAEATSSESTQGGRHGG